MKKNITINLCGRLFQIDEDAYELLKNYEDVLRRYFRKQEGGEEIAADLESRIAELLAELKQQGVEAITIEHVQDIIRRIGRPEEISDTDGDDADNAETNKSEETAAASSQAGSWKAKRFYRDGERKMVAGVLAGLSNYFGGDVTLWRLGFVLLILIGSGSFSLFSGFRGFHIINICGIVLYIIMAIIAPVAHTPEERLQMKGREVTPETLADEIRQEAESKEETGSDSIGRQENDGCMKGFFSIVAIMFKIFLIFIGLLLFIPAIVFFCVFIAVAVA
ncbi:MAG: PspC domain-containing protein, partial [Prevotella sp.]|nr:PspC domain-containing protein [Prevotella sp.]